MISVILCTYNRDRVFEETVRSFLECRTDGIEHELLLVDNNSTDKTREIGKQFATIFPQIRYMNEPLQGHPHAKNRGIRESRGEIVAFVDDDVFFSPSWLTALASSFERNADVACIGGKVVPHFEDGRPSWIDDDITWIYGVTRYGDIEREIRFPEIPIGCNMAFRRSVFDRLGDFHTSLGRKPGSLLSADEDHFLLCVEKAGLKTLYSPDVQVFHRIPSARTTRDWILRRHYWQGLSVVISKQVSDEPLPRTKLVKQAIRKFLGLLRQWRVIVGLLKSAGGSVGGELFKKKLDIYYNLGALRQMVAESIVVPDGKSADSGRRSGDK